MKITTLIELENSEVEKLLDITFVYAEEKIGGGDIVHACVEGLKDNKTNEWVSVEDTMEKLVAILRANYIIPFDVDIFSYEMFTCDRMKGYAPNENIHKNLIITYSQQK